MIVLNQALAKKTVVVGQSVNSKISRSARSSGSKSNLRLKGMLGAQCSQFGMLTCIALAAFYCHVAAL